MATTRTGFTPRDLGITAAPVAPATDERRTKDLHYAIERLRLIAEDVRNVEALDAGDLLDAQALAQDIVETLTRERRRRG